MKSTTLGKVGYDTKPQPTPTLILNLTCLAKLSTALFDQSGVSLLVLAYMTNMNTHLQQIHGHSTYNNIVMYRQVNYVRQIIINLAVIK